MRSMLAELGIAIPVGLEKVLHMARQIVDGEVELDKVCGLDCRRAMPDHDTSSRISARADGWQSPGQPR
jgi:hypothetical protein